MQALFPFSGRGWGGKGGVSRLYPYITLYHDQANIINSLTDEQAGKIIKAMFEYARTGTTTNLDQLLSVVFIFFRQGMEEGWKSGRVGKYSCKWQGGKTPKNKADRTSSRYQKWRKGVFERDDFVCQKCHRRGGRLNAHHIVKFSECEEKRFDVDNGITLCEKCHREVHGNEKQLYPVHGI